MDDVMVSIRMPKPMIDDLKNSAKTFHFLDLSEEVRSIVRKKWLTLENPDLFQIQKLREDVEDEIKKKSESKVREEIAKELEKIKAQLKQGGLING